MTFMLNDGRVAPFDDSPSKYTRTSIVVAFQGPLGAGERRESQSLLKDASQKTTPGSHRNKLLDWHISTKGRLLLACDANTYHKI